MIASMLVFKKMPANSLPKPVEKKYQPETRINSEKFELLDSKFWEYPVNANATLGTNDNYSLAFKATVQPQ